MTYRKLTFLLLLISLALFAMSGCVLKNKYQNSERQRIGTKNGIVTIKILKSWNLTDESDSDIDSALENGSSYAAIQVFDKQDFSDFSAFLEGRSKYVIDHYGEPEKVEELDTKFDQGKRLFTSKCSREF